MGQDTSGPLTFNVNTIKRQRHSWEGRRFYDHQECSFTYSMEEFTSLHLGNTLLDASNFTSVCQDGFRGRKV